VNSLIPVNIWGQVFTFQFFSPSGRKKSEK
jgi:hypothetical protein